MDNEFYDQLANTALPNYMFFGTHDKYSYYYRRVISGCLRAVDVIHSLPQFDGENLAAWGSSQGGALSIITTALDKRIKMLVALCPAMCDFTGYLNGRAGGWPHFFNQENRSMYQNKQVISVLSYYDVVNFARQITVPGFYSWGFNDETTPPTSFYSAFNVIKAPKRVHIIPEGKHKIYPEQVDKTYAWILEKLREK
ncbi:MAG: acetylxylan esterase [Bacteroidales bacterium]|nr:acetylxylan esterase [Bacteroidales bacterium]